MISTRTIAFAAAAAFVSLAAVPASATDPKAPKPQETPKAAKEKLYCVKGTTTGTLIPKKVCKTRDQWIESDGFDPLEAKQK
ncbi:hypothetical protein ACMGDH_14465 [Sphingomonas sp. DT-207]|uniref:hypothetical protein n=1 Tax=Sphingomonas sp. DT-207 TaxID=3396167 RepID=UPI003F1CE47C